MSNENIKRIRSSEIELKDKNEVSQKTKDFIDDRLKNVFTELSSVQDSIKNFKGKLKYNRKIDEYFSDNAEIKDMSENAVDIISKVYDNGAEGTTVAIWFNLGVTYLSSEKYCCFKS